jgi:pre-mRNA-splicing factor 38A
LLGAFYLRLVGKPAEIYEHLEPLYNDYSRIRFRDDTGLHILHMDEFIDNILRNDFCCDIQLPYIPSRHIMEMQGSLKPRVSALLEDLEMFSDDEEKKEPEPEPESRNKLKLKVQIKCTFVCLNIIGN